MTGSGIKAIIDALPNPGYLYGFRMSSGKEVILAKTIKAEDAVGKNAPDEIVIKGDIVKVASVVSTPLGPQAKIVRFLDAKDIVEVMSFYDPQKDSELGSFGEAKGN